MRHYDRVVADCDRHIREGRPQSASKILGKLNSVKVPREFRLPLAQLCRRVGSYSMGMKLLANLVQVERRNSSVEASPAELAEYGVLLLRSGALTEAIDTLNQVNVEEVPDALLYHAFGHFHRWEYKEAIPYLERYVQAPLAPYALLVGKANLAYACVEMRQDERALELLDEVIAAARAGDHKQLQSNCLACKAQVYLQKDEFSKTRAELERATSLFSLSHTFDQVSVIKWKLILDGLESGDAKPFDELRKIAAENRDWEALREADLYSLKVDYVRQRFLHLYFGTPHAYFREIAARMHGGPPTQKMYVLGAKSAPRMDLRTGTVDGKELINPGGKCHQLIDILLRDFYQPLRIGGLFSALFPKEHFDISSSPDRVRQVIRRTRRWLENENIPVGIIERDSFYSLYIFGGFSFRMTLERQAVDPFTLSVETLKTSFADRPFFARDIQNLLKISKWGTHQILHRAIQEGLIDRLGHTDRSASYQFATPVQKKAA